MNINQEDSESEEDMELDLDDDSEEDEDEDDELFDSDEEEEANNTNRVTKASKPIKKDKPKAKVTTKAKVTAKPKAKRTSQLDSSESESDYDSDDRDDRDTRGRGKSGSKSGSYPPPSYDSDDSAVERRKRAVVEEEPVEDMSEPADVEDYIRLQVRRIFIEKWIQEPFFDAVMKKQFVRVYIGNNPTDDSAIYRMCEIVNVTQYKRQYKLTVGDSFIMTDKAINVSIGKSVLTKRLDIVSNYSITQNELNKYHQDLNKQIPIIKTMTKNEASKRRKRVNDQLNHQYTNEEIKNLVNNRLGFSNFLTTEYSTAKERLEEKLEKATTDQDDGLSIKLQREMDKMEANYQVQKERNVIEASKRVGLNQRNRLKNSKSDIQASVLRKEKEERQAEILEAGGVKEGTLDPFRRREARPQITPVNLNSKPKKIKKDSTTNGYSYFHDLNIDEVYIDMLVLYCVLLCYIGIGSGIVILVLLWGYYLLFCYCYNVYIYNYNSIYILYIYISTHLTNTTLN